MVNILSICIRIYVCLPISIEKIRRCCHIITPWERHILRRRGTTHMLGLILLLLLKGLKVFNKGLRNISVANWETYLVAWLLYMMWQGGRSAVSRRRMFTINESLAMHLILLNHLIILYVTLNIMHMMIKSRFLLRHWKFVCCITTLLRTFIHGSHCLWKVLYFSLTNQELIIWIIFLNIKRCSNFRGSSASSASHSSGSHWICTASSDRWLRSL